VKLIVTGASGFLGREFCAAASNAGHSVVALVRPTSDATGLIAARTIGRDLFELSIDDVPEEIDAVVHFATGTVGNAAEMTQVAVEGTRRMVELARAAGIPRFVHISSMSVHPGSPRAGGIEPRPDLRGGYALSKVKAEQALTGDQRDESTEIIIFRPGLVFGREMSDALAGTAVRLPFGLALGFGRKAQGVPWLDIEDLNSALLGVLASPIRPADAPYELLSEPTPTKQQIVQLVEQYTGYPRHTLWLPAAVPVAAAAVIDAIRRNRSWRTVYAIRRAWRFDPINLDSSPAWRRAGASPTATVGESVRRALTIDATFDGALDSAVISRAASLSRVAASVDRTDGEARQIVLVGAGRIVEEMHLPALDALDRVAVTAVVDPQVARAAAIGERLDATAFTRLADVPDEVLAGATVVVATPGSSHVEIAEEAISRGASVLLEKPAALRLADFERLCALETPSAPISVFQNYRLRPAVLQLWKFLLTHDVGPLQRARLRFASPPLKLERARWMRSEQRNRVLLYELSIHFVDLLALVAGEFSEIASSRVRVSGDGLRTISFGASAASESCDDIFVDLDLGGTAPGVRLYLEFARTACALEFFPDAFRVLPGKPNPLDDVSTGLIRLGGALRARARRDRATVRAMPHRMIYKEHFRRCDGSKASAVGLTGVVQTMRSLELLAEALYESEGRAVT
jgi:nucleoside-diphosphate-sugar epimerase/predicted dehydrogenase